MSSSVRNPHQFCSFKETVCLPSKDVEIRSDIFTFPSIIPSSVHPSTQNWAENELSLLDQFITCDLLRRSARGDGGTLNITSSTSTQRQTFVNIFSTFLFRCSSISSSYPCNCWFVDCLVAHTFRSSLSLALIGGGRWHGLKDVLYFLNNTFLFENFIL